MCVCVAFLHIRCVKISSPSFLPRDILSVSFLIFSVFFFFFCPMYIQTQVHVLWSILSACTHYTYVEMYPSSGTILCVCAHAVALSLFRVHFYSARPAIHGGLCDFAGDPPPPPLVAPRVRFPTRGPPLCRGCGGCSAVGRGWQ